jgi:hypothetical protein
MTRNRRTLVYVAFALILGGALATAIVLARTPAPAGGSAAKAGVSQSSGSVLGDTLGSASVATADPAKQQPQLDKFTSKDPFIPLTTPSSGGGSSSSGGGSSTTTAYAAHIKVDGASYTVVNGDKVPSGTAAFSISSVTANDVTFAVLEGHTLENGDSAITVSLGESVKATLDSGKSYTLAVVSIGSKTTGGGSNGSGSSGTLSTSGHTISVLSVTSNNGVALATLEVDGKTYPDKKVGVVISTSWGQVKILAIDVNGQTVTVMHGDQTVVLRAGQVVVK